MAGILLVWKFSWAEFSSYHKMALQFARVNNMIKTIMHHRKYSRKESFKAINLCTYALTNHIVQFHKWMFLHDKLY